MVIGRVFCRYFILWMFCFLLRLWIIRLEYRNNIVLKKVWVEMWRKVSWGRFRLIVIIMRFSWFEVEKVMIFLMLF